MPHVDEKARKEYRKRHYQEHKEEILRKMKIYSDLHKEELIIKHKEYYQAHREERIEKQKEYHATHREQNSQTKHKRYVEKKDEILAGHKRYYQEHKLEVLEKTAAYRLAHPVNKEERSEYHKRHIQDQKVKVLTYYGNGNCACVVCGCSDIRKLSIDHINGGGRKHLKSISSHIYTWLIRNNFPEGFQTLCMNDQFVKRTVNNELKKSVLTKGE